MSPMKIAVINSNLNAGGKTAVLHGALLDCCREMEGVEPLDVSLASTSLPHCDGARCYQDPGVIELTGKLQECQAMLLCSPIYNYDLNASAKNLIELTGSAWKGKVFGLVCVAGSEKSYLSALSFINSLMVDYRCLVIPRFVFAHRADFGEGNVFQETSQIPARIEQLVKAAKVLGEAVAKL